MDVLDAIMNRKSIRRFTEQEIDVSDVRTILKAGMAGPCCVNARDWIFIAVQNPGTLNRMADANGQPAEPLRGARLAVLICGDLKRAFPAAKEYWVIDCAIAAQNMILAAEGLGIGSVWLGTWPQTDRVERQKQIFGLPSDVIPHSVIAFGYPDENPDKSDKPEWETDRVYFEKFTL